MQKADLPRRLAGWLCLDFVNTIDPRHGSRAHDYLKDYRDLLRWCEYAEVLTGEEETHLAEAANRHPAVAEAVFQRAIALREALYTLFAAMIKGVAVQESELEALNIALSEGMARALLRTQGQGFSWEWDRNSLALERVLWPLARSAAELLTSEELMQLRECPGNDGCGWLFLDSSRNHTRRWCDMNGCGNRAKARRHYQRREKQQEPEKS